MDDIHEENKIIISNKFKELGYETINFDPCEFNLLPKIINNDSRFYYLIKYSPNNTSYVYFENSSLKRLEFLNNKMNINHDIISDVFFYIHSTPKIQIIKQ